jgi:hypothetical protein
MSKSVSIKAGVIAKSSGAPRAEEDSQIDLNKRRTIIKAALTSVPTIVTVTARPSFAASNTSGHSPVTEAETNNQTPPAPRQSFNWVDDQEDLNEEDVHTWQAPRWMWGSRGRNE